MVFNRGPGVISISEFFDPVKIRLILVAPRGYLGNITPGATGLMMGLSAGQPVVVPGCSQGVFGKYAPSSAEPMAYLIWPLVQFKGKPAAEKE